MTGRKKYIAAIGGVGACVAICVALLSRNSPNALNAPEEGPEEKPAATRTGTAAPSVAWEKSPGKKCTGGRAHTVSYSSRFRPARSRTG